MRGLALLTYGDERLAIWGTALHCWYRSSWRMWGWWFTNPTKVWVMFCKTVIKFGVGWDAIYRLWNFASWMMNHVPTSSYLIQLMVKLRFKCTSCITLLPWRWSSGRRSVLILIKSWLLCKKVQIFWPERRYVSIFITHAALVQGIFTAVCYALCSLTLYCKGFFRSENGRNGGQL